MSVHHYPTLLPGVLQINFRWQLVLSAEPDSVGSTVLHFVNANPFPVGWTPAATFPTDVRAWLQTAFLGTVPFNLAYPQMWIFVQSDTSFFVYDVPSVIYTGSRLSPLDPALCVCYTRTAAPGGPNYRGRNSLLPIPRDFIANGTYSAAAQATYEARVVDLMSPIISNGVTFNPAIVSPQLGTVAQVDTIRFVPRPCYVYRRRAGRFTKATAWNFVP